MTGWAAPRASRPVEADVAVPGSKSATARALVLSGLAAGDSVIAGALAARDTSLMIDGLRRLGAVIDDRDPDAVRVTGIDALPDSAEIDCGLAGTVMRFLPPVAALGAGTVSFTGDPAASARPMAGLLAALGGLGADVSGSALPFSVKGPVTGGTVTLDSSASSQFVSGLLLAGARMPEGVVITHAGDPIPSAPHIAMTVAALRARGVAVVAGNDTWRVAPGVIQPVDTIIEPDLTTAAVFLAAALVAGGTVRVPGWPGRTTQPGGVVPQVLARMGGMASWSADGLTIRGTGDVHPIDIDLHDTSELTPVVAALAALADGESVIRGVAHIAGHETDRLAALTSQITALGGYCRRTSDGLVIRPGALRGGVFATFADHRMAHAGALIGLRVDGVELDDVGCTSKTMPAFPKVWQALVR